MSKIKLFVNPVNVMAFLMDEERRSSIFLIAAAAIAMFLANGPFYDFYYDFFHYYFRVGALELDLKHWINEALMALFFLVVGLEIKRELIDGELRTWHKAAFPLAAAVGGMVVPALIFAIINPTPPQSLGWAIPMATDIAIALGVLALLGKKIPKALRVFLLSLAIVDDIGSIAVISLFYNQPSNMLSLMFAVILTICILLVRNKKSWPVLFAFGGVAIVYSLLLAGVSGTLAGVILAFSMPLLSRRSDKQNLQLAEKIEDMLIPFVSFVVVPLFVLANAGLRLTDIDLSNGGWSVFGGVLLGLFIGKPLGITLAAYIAHKTKLADKPYGITWPQITGVGFVAGIGFTISLLITNMAYTDHPTLMSAAILGVFIASILAAITGLAILRRHSRKV